MFGPDKYVQRMALSEALRDDQVALETGVFCLLPQLDMSGRQVLYLDPSRNTREGYTSESLVSTVAVDCFFCPSFCLKSYALTIDGKAPCNVVCD